MYLVWTCSMVGFSVYPLTNESVWSQSALTDLVSSSIYPMCESNFSMFDETHAAAVYCW